MKWKDNSTKAVHVLSNHLSAFTSVSTKRRQKGSAAKKDLEIPQMVKTYNQFMGGVDLADQLKGSYAIDIRSRYKYYLRLIFDLVDTIVVNSYIIYNELHHSDGKSLGHLEFRQQVVHGLLGNFCSRRRSHPTGRIRKRPWQPEIVNAMHMPVFNKQRKRCKHCAIDQVENRSAISCETCSVLLCLQNGRNCFKEYHS